MMTDLTAASRLRWLGIPPELPGLPPDWLEENFHVRAGLGKTSSRSWPAWH